MRLVSNLIVAIQRVVDDECPQKRWISNGFSASTTGMLLHASLSTIRRRMSD